MRYIFGAVMLYAGIVLIAASYNNTLSGVWAAIKA